MGRLPRQMAPFAGLGEIAQALDAEPLRRATEATDPAGKKRKKSYMKFQDCPQQPTRSTTPARTPTGPTAGNH